jgi:hypothetical protein
MDRCWGGDPGFVLRLLEDLLHAGVRVFGTIGAFK